MSNLYEDEDFTSLKVQPTGQALPKLDEVLARGNRTPATQALIRALLHELNLGTLDEDKEYHASALIESLLGEDLFDAVAAVVVELAQGA